jgi:hypothetical protein
MNDKKASSIRLGNKLDYRLREIRRQEILLKYSGNKLEIYRASQPAAGRLGEITVSKPIKFKITR